MPFSQRVIIVEPYFQWYPYEVIKQAYQVYLLDTAIQNKSTNTAKISGTNLWRSTGRVMSIAGRGALPAYIVIM
jgi:hypothetical protein